MAASENFGNVVMDVLPFLERMGSAAGFGKSAPPFLVGPQIVALRIRSAPRRNGPRERRAAAQFVARARNLLASFRKTDARAAGTETGPARGLRRAGRGDFGTSAWPVAAPSPTAEGSTMTTGYVAIVALTTLVVVAVVALAALEFFSHRRDH
jgi:hypothetical protein